MVSQGMLIKTIDAIAYMEGAPQSEQLFPVEKEYAPGVTALNRTGILTLLPKSESIGGIGINGKVYPKPTQEPIVELFDHNREHLGKKSSTGKKKGPANQPGLPIENFRSWRAKRYSGGAGRGGGVFPRSNNWIISVNVSFSSDPTA